MAHACRMATIALLLFAGASIACGRVAPPWHELTTQYSFEQYVKDFKKPYTSGTEEWHLRARLFQASLQDALRHNREGHRYKKGINKFSDWTKSEGERLLGGRIDATYAPRYREEYQGSGRPTSSFPSSLDYRESVPSVLTAVKDQGHCGDCWAFAVTEAVESALAIRTGKLYVLSVQQVTSCTPRRSSCYSCGGNLPEHAYDYITEFKGLCEEWQVPFTSYDVSQNETTWPQCPKHMYATSAYIDGYYSIRGNNDTAVIEALNILGPLSIALDASLWHNYEGGIFDDCTYQKNTTVSFDHAVLLVGYGRDVKIAADYWIVRNSWAPDWGEHGYIRVLREKPPTCGWGGSYSCLKNDTSRARSCGMCGILAHMTFPRSTTTAVMVGGGREGHKV